MPPRTIDPYDVKNIYRSERDIQRAIAKGTFTHAKVMHMDWATKNIFSFVTMTIIIRKVVINECVW